MPRPADDENADIKETDPFLLLGQVYQTHDADDADTDAEDESRDGTLRLEVTTGDGGTGAASFVIEQSDEGIRNYLNADGDAVPMRQIHAGDDESYIVFTYEATETIEEGELQFVVDDDWSEPQEDSSSQAGYTRVEGAGVASFNNFTVTVPIAYAASGDKISIHYGTDGGNAVAPKDRETSEFDFRVNGKPIDDDVEITIRSQASGRGSVSADPETVNAGAEDTVQIIYDPIGEISGGRVKLTVDDSWVGEDGVMGEFVASTGTAKNGGKLTEDELETYGITKNEVLVTGVNIDADETLTFTYTGMVPAAKEDLPHLALLLMAAKVPAKLKKIRQTSVDVGDVTVTITDAAAGSGMVSAIAPMATLLQANSEVTKSRLPTRRSERSVKVRQSQLPFPTVGHHLSTLQQHLSSWEPSPLCTYSSLLTTLLRMLSLKMVVP